MTMRRLLPTFCGLLLSASTALAAPTIPGQRVENARYGEALFHFYKQDYFTALTLLMAARSQGRLERDWFQAELLLGSLKLSYGLTDSAERIFNRLLRQQAPREVHDHAWYYLAQLAFQKDRLDQAAHALAQIGDRLPPDFAGRRQLLSALVHMRQGDFAGAATMLDPWHGPPEDEPYGRYNLGVALIRSGQLEAGVQQLRRVGRIPAKTEEALALRDQANVAIARALLPTQPQQAKRVLQQVRLQGPVSNLALLGAGWAELMAGDHRAALVPWQELRRRSIADPAVQEAMLAIPYALLQLQAREQAANLYRTATELLSAEAGRIEEAMREIERGALLQVTLQIDPRKNELPPLEHVPGRAYLGTLLASHGFRRALQDYQDIDALAANLRWWLGELDQLEIVLADHRSRFERKLPELEQRLAALAPTALEQRYQALKAALPLGKEADLRALERQLRELRQRHAALGSIKARAEDDFLAFEGRIQLMRERVAALLERVEQRRDTQQQVLQQQALQALGERRDAVRSQVTQARFILAQLYDPAAERPGRNR
ncbi:MAG: hypothetical protein GX093_10125 [Xanthomonadaceae bacterium]|nr:hypothetical protein [Xanthomonadaceae bacterium]